MMPPKQIIALGDRAIGIQILVLFNRLTRNTRKKYLIFLLSLDAFTLHFKMLKRLMGKEQNR